MIIDGTDWVHAFWTEEGVGESTAPEGSSRSLMHSQMRFGSTEWSFPEVLAESALYYDISLTVSGSLNLAYVRTLHTPERPAGVYVKKNTGGGEAWGPSLAVSTDIYMRLLTSQQAYVAVTESAGTTYVFWKEPRQGQTLFAVSNDNGLNWEGPAAFATEAEQVQEPRLASVSNGAPLLIWQSVFQGVCTLFQEELTPSSIQNTDLPAELGSKTIITGLSACPRSDLFLPLGDGLLWVWGEGSISLSLVAWQPTVGEWSYPLDVRVNFIDQESQQPVGLSDLHAVLSNEQLVVIGVDQILHEVWVTQTQVNALDIAYAPPPVWNEPTTIFNSLVDLQSPVLATDPEQRLHVFWSQSVERTAKGPQSAIYYTGWDGQLWSRPAEILRSPEGITDQPSVGVHPDNRLLVTWRGGRPTNIYFSWANAAQANRLQEWAKPLPLSLPLSGSSSPVIKVDHTGIIYVVFSVPLNEGRGIYLTQSNDRGDTWSKPAQVFDGAAADWEMVDQPGLAITPEGHLHVLWSRYALPQQGNAIGLYYAQSLDGGLTWSDPEIVSENPVAWGQIIPTDQGVLHNVWLEIISGRQEFKHRYSTDDGLTWTSTPSFLSIGEGIGLVDLASDPAGKLHLLWVTREDNELILQYKRWQSEDWVDEESLVIGQYPVHVIQTLSTAASTFGGPNVIYSSLIGDVQSGSQQFYLYYTGHRSDLVEVIAGDPSSPSEPVLTATPEPTPTPALLATQPPLSTPTASIDLSKLDDAPQGGNEWTGLIIGTALTAFTAVIAFGFRMFFTRNRR